MSDVVRRASVTMKRRATTSLVPVRALPAGTAPPVIESVPSDSTASTAVSAVSVTATVVRRATQLTVDASEQWYVCNACVV